ncbi:MAG: GNAT family N-acetyltransferase [Anaerolineae bacterium]|nr:GNAT family N-acetyltransferase [Anaerolineae bacterium]
MRRVTIRPMTAADIEPCATLMAKSPLWQRYGVTVASASARFESALRDGGIILVADGGDNQPLGFIWVVLRGAFNRSGYIPLIGVNAHQRGGGIGQQLLDAAEDRARQTAIHDMFLLCSDFNVDAQRFYQRQGYAQVGAIPDYVIPGITELIFHKRL